ncbi:MAG: TlyA family RNA methyltransferase [Desulfobacterales bacterium]|jgi:23S rRNA (cytidine1920-2'-O)/16S rRNA (cytidine1409-2'-O)-methyltransferase|nr:TlyA family RNA methyltransferase [Desulfobacterales bacterium]
MPESRPGAASVSRVRLDQLVVDRQMAPSRQRARALIMAGKVMVEDRVCDKPGTRFAAEAVITLRGEDIPYVSRGGVKLAALLDALALGIQDWACLDVGASTGGFTDCLLQHGARRVYAVDVGYGQLAWKLRQDPRVIPIERTNIRYMADDTLPEAVDLVTIDASFISLRIVVPAVLRFVRPGGWILALIKPQFEVGRGQVGKGGVVRDPHQHQAVIDDLCFFFSGLGLTVRSVLPSPILGPKGNREFLAALTLAQQHGAEGHQGNFSLE